MPAKNSCQSRREQALRTFTKALEHPLVKQAIVPLYAAWRKRQDERLREYRKDNATDPSAYWKAVDEVEFTTKDIEPSAEKLLIGKLRDGSLPFFVRDDVGNIVEGDPSLDLGTLAAVRRVLIGDDDLNKAFHKPKKPGKRGPTPDEKNRVKEKIRHDVNAHVYTVNYLKSRSRLQKDWAAKYDCTRSTFLEARKEFLLELETPTNSDKN
jgi:hypothetical protein